MDRPHILTRHETLRLTTAERERRAGHADHAERAQVLSDLRWEADLRGLSDRGLHDACGLDDGTLRDCSLPTPTLHAALRHVRALPR